MIIRVENDVRSYDIHLERGILNQVSSLIDVDRKVLVVTDTNVPAMYGQTVAKGCKEAYILAIPSGEQSKNIVQLQEILKALLDNEFSRGDCVIAVGGGVVGDMAGFAASIYMRGIDFYNIPTTLLSQVDSSIGGKTAIDFQGVKNIVGSFYMPKAVIIDPDTLDTLDERLLHAGLAEAIKTGAILDKPLFDLIADSKNLRDDLMEIIAMSLKDKAYVVKEDPNEKGLRKVLNFGHTIGHAVESINEGDLYHGECVAIGMMYMCSDEVRQALEKVLCKYNLPTAITHSPEQLLPYIMHDKKRSKNSISTVNVNKIGSFELIERNSDEILALMEE